jgi:hypothetical protein
MSTFSDSPFVWPDHVKSIKAVDVSEDRLDDLLKGFEPSVDRRGTAQEIPGFVSFDRGGTDRIDGKLYRHGGRLTFVSKEAFLHSGDAVYVHVGDVCQIFVIRHAREGQRADDHGVLVFSL